MPTRIVNSYREASPLRLTPYEADRVALEKQLEGSEILEKVICIPRSLLKWWLQEENILQGQPLHPLSQALQIFTDTSKEGLGRGTRSLPESKLHINYLELKLVFRALKEFHDLCSNKIILITTDKTVNSSVKNRDLVFQETGNTQGLTHSKQAECGSYPG